MTANSTTTSTGYRAVFYKLEDTCVHVISSGGGAITSPGYPRNYGPDLDCAWYIDVQEGVAKLSFESFDVYSSRRCSEDKLTVPSTNSYSTLARYTYCGTAML